MYQELSRCNSQTIDVVREQLREQVEETLEMLSNLVVCDAMLQLEPEALESPCSDEAARVRAAVRFLGQVLAAWPHLPAEAFLEEEAGFGSSVLVVDVESGQQNAYSLMIGPLIDLDGGQVSLASPMGQALWGAQAGKFVTVTTPQGVRRLRVLEVQALQDRLRQELRVPSMV